MYSCATYYVVNKRLQVIGRICVAVCRDSDLAKLIFSPEMQ